MYRTVSFLNTLLKIPYNVQGINLTILNLWDLHAYSINLYLHHAKFKTGHLIIIWVLLSVFLKIHVVQISHFMICQFSTKYRDIQQHVYLGKFGVFRVLTLILFVITIFMKKRFVSYHEGT